MFSIFLLIATCIFWFVLYLVTSYRLLLIALLIFCLGNQYYYFQHYFRGGWEAAGFTHPFNEEFIFSMIVLETVATVSGFVARIVDLRWKTEGRELRFRRRSYLLFVFATILVMVILIFSVPLGFDRPIDLKLCDNSVSVRPDYCPE